MSAFRSILCPVDFSSHSREAIRYAERLARRSGGRVDVLFVNDPLLLAAAAAALHRRRKFLEQTAGELQSFVRRALGSGHRAGVTVDCFIASGDPGEQILRAAKRLGSDVIVIGTHGLSGVNKLFFGSTTEHVLREASIPVLALPPGLSTRTSSARRKGGRAANGVLSLTRIVAPVDLTGQWTTDLTQAAELARSFEAELLLVHVVVDGPLPPWFKPHGRANRLQARVTRAARSLARAAAPIFPDVRVATRVVSGNLPREIARLAAEDPASLVVMGLRGTSGGWHSRRGAIAYGVLTRTSTPVLALPRRSLRGTISARLKRAVSRALAERDRLELAGVDALLSAAATPKPAAHRRPRR